LKAHAPTENTTDKAKESFYEELEHIFNKFHKYHRKILLEDFNAKAHREYVPKPTTGNKFLHKISYNNGVSAVNFITSKSISISECSKLCN
jgi:hypothetical protein